ncbi:hypothetical protein [Baaleninema sp.]
MIWHPEPEDEEVNRYLHNVNHAPYFTIALIMGIVICLATVAIVSGIV